MTLGVTSCLPFLVLDPAPDVFDCVSALHFEGDGLSRGRLYEDLHGLQRKKYGVKGQVVVVGLQEVGLFGHEVALRSLTQGQRSCRELWK